MKNTTIPCWFSTPLSPHRLVEMDNGGKIFIYPASFLHGVLHDGVQQVFGGGKVVETEECIQHFQAGMFLMAVFQLVFYIDGFFFHTDVFCVDGGPAEPTGSRNSSFC